MANVPPVEHWFNKEGQPSEAYFRYHTDTRDAINELDDTTASLAIETWSFLVEFPENRDYRFIINLPYGGTINSITTRSTTGTCTFTGKINTTALGGTANSVSTTEQERTHSSANTFVAGDDFVGTVSSNSSCENMTVTVKVTRAI